MGKSRKKPPVLSGNRAWVGTAAPVAGGWLLFVLICLIAASTAKGATMFCAIAGLAALLLRFRTLRTRMGLPLVALGLYVLMDGLSSIYAISGKFALNEFMKVLSAFCLALVLRALETEQQGNARRIALTLSVCVAAGSLASIDLFSTHVLRNMILWIPDRLTGDYAQLYGVESGIRMTSVFANPNIFAGFAGLGVLLCLGLADTAETEWQRLADGALLYLNALAFLLAFSMGASAFIALAFLVFLALEPGERRAGMLVLMLETLVLVAIAAAVVSATSLEYQAEPRATPLVCTVVGAAAICVLDHYVGRRVSARLREHGKSVIVLIGVVLAALAVFVLAAWNLTGPASLSPGASLRRAAYPDPGAYSLTLQAEGQVNVRVESQNRKETMMHTSTVLYNGAAQEAQFTVPEDSLVVYFNFSAPEGAVLQSAVCGTEKIPLAYRLLPSFIANRLQGLLANENAIQRLVFFDDGMKLFRRSPIVGLGMGAYESGIKSVQSFYYETKYAHDHYIQSMVDTGVIGLCLFLLLLGVSAAAVWRGRTAHPLAPALGAALVFMAGHAVTEVVFSSAFYLPVAFGVFALIDLCCGPSLPKPRLSQRVKTIFLACACGGVTLFGILLGCNMAAARMMATHPSYDTLEQAIRLDRFEWADYALSYVYNTNADSSTDTLRKADAYARRLAKLDSNTIPIYLAEYYFRTDRPAQAIEMVEKYLDYVSSDPEAWQQSFDLLRNYEEDSDVYRDGVVRLAEMLQARNETNMEEITLNEETQAFVAGILQTAP